MNPTPSTTQANDSIESALNHQSERIRPYLPEIFKRLTLVYAIPFTLVLLTSTLGGIVVSNFIPVSTTNIIIFALNIFILVRVWRWAEARWHGTSLFIMYTRFSRARRDVRGETTSARVLDAHLDQFNQVAEAFLAQIHNLGVQPYQDTKKKR